LFLNINHMITEKQPILFKVPHPSTSWVGSSSRNGRNDE